MPDKEAILLFEQLYRRTDKQIRDLLAMQELEPGAPEIDTINVLIGDGAAVLTAGVAAAIRVDFRSVITGVYVQEFDGTTGSVVLNIQKSPAGPSPTFVSIVGSTPPTISSGRYGEITTFTGWTTRIDRGDVLRFLVTSATAITRILLGVRIKRLEP